MQDLSRVSPESVAFILRCAECEAAWPPTDEERWRAYLGSDTLDVLPEVVLYCPSCAVREFGTGPKRNGRPLGQARRLNLPDAIDPIRPAIVQIRSGSPILGTAFFVDEQAHVVTAKHVVGAGRAQVRYPLARPIPHWRIDVPGIRLSQPPLRS